MFYRSFSLIAGQARGANLPSPRVQGPGLTAAEAAAAQATGLELRDLPLSARLDDPAAYRSIQLERRQSLEALLKVPPDEGRLRRAVDLIGVICEESRWGANAEGEAFDDDAHPEIDFQCAETASLLSWTARALGDALPTRTAGKLLYEVRRRVFSPFLAHDDYPFLRGRGNRPLTVLADILLSAITLERSEQRRAALIRQALRSIDQAVSIRADRAEALADAAAETGAIADAAACLYCATQGRVDLRPAYPPQEWLDQLLYPWLEGEYFCDPAGGDMLPEVSGAELYRIGCASDDDALMALGASLHRARPAASATVTGRLLDQTCLEGLNAERRKPPRIRSAATPGGRVMVSRFSGMTCAVHTGGNRGNAGGIALFCDGRPVLVEAPEAFNLPRIAGRAPLAWPEQPCEADFKPAADRDILSVDLTHAWSPGIAHSCQRTAMIERADAVLRLVDAFELAEAAVITFRFHTPLEPSRIPGGLQLGDVAFTWEGELTPSVTPLPRAFPRPGGAPLYRIDLTTPAPAVRAFHTFIFARAAQGPTA